MYQRPYTVELFSDSGPESEAIDYALEGVDYFNRLTRGALIARVATKAVAFPGDEDDALTMRTIEKQLSPLRRSDIQLLITDRCVSPNAALREQGVMNLNGVAIFNRSSYGFQTFAAVSSFHNASPDAIAGTTAHELGHALGISYESAALHCQDTSCLMYKSSEHRSQRFCRPCRTQLAEVALKGLGPREATLYENWGRKKPRYDEVVEA